jgi:hypothetical protein
MTINAAAPENKPPRPMMFIVNGPEFDRPIAEAASDIEGEVHASNSLQIQRTFLFT